MNRRIVRVEVPVMLYVDVEHGPGYTPETLRAFAAAKVFEWLGAPGDETGIDINVPPDSGLCHARLYTADVESCDSAAGLDLVDGE